MNRLANWFIRTFFNIKLNHTTNAFKAYRRETISGGRPLVARHFNRTVELPLKAIVHGFSWTTIPITWRNRRTGSPKLKLKDIGSRYLYIWLEKYFSRSDYRRTPVAAASATERTGLTNEIVTAKAAEEQRALEAGRA